MTFFDCNGRALDDRRIEELANHRGISLRTGCFCNPGAGEVAHGLGPEIMRSFFASENALSFQELRREMQRALRPRRERGARVRRHRVQLRGRRRIHPLCRAPARSHGRGSRRGRGDRSAVLDRPRFGLKAEREGQAIRSTSRSPKRSARTCSRAGCVRATRCRPSARWPNSGSARPARCSRPTRN